MSNTVNIFGLEYVAVITNAPDDYDYEYCIRVFRTYLDDGDREGWFVLMPSRSVEYQCGRYHSGLYAAQPVKDFGLFMTEDAIQHILLSRMKIVPKSS